MEFFIGFVLLFPLFMMAVTVHELSHGLAALYFGDSTARQAGRLTLNPLKHIDPVGTVLLPLLLRLLNSPLLFGWAKPVPINALNFRHPRRDIFWVGAAGPAANFLLAAVTALVLKAGGAMLPVLVHELGRYLILINLILGTFNLLPIPPLDGSRILMGVLPARFSWLLAVLERWGIVLVLLLLYLGLDDLLLEPIVFNMARWLGVG
ncbi:MAG: site-2 protease family protein [Candidatus Omnitrophica bacterium]|nr:site-2 protease family protein [Candidatus Omnitrophota bacterium]